MSKSIRKLRIGVAGLGRIGWGFHCKTTAEHRQWQLAAVADPDESRRQEAQQTCGCRAFAEVEQMIASADLDAIAIATPTHLHKAHTIAALKAGLHVMLEKPMAPSLADARAIVREAAKRQRVLTVYQPRRADASFQHLKKVVDSGRIGEVYHVRQCSNRFVRRDDWQSLQRYGGGMLNNYGAHGLDMLLALTGYDVAKVFGNLRRVASLGDAEDVVKVVYQTAGGILAEIDINQATPHRPYDLEVYGTRGVILRNGSELTVRWLSPRQLKAKQLDTSLASAGRQYPSDQVEFQSETIKINPKYRVDVYEDFAKAIRTGREPFVAPQQTLEVMRVMDLCRKQAGGIMQTPLA